MKVKIDKDWCMDAAKREDGCEVEAGPTKITVDCDNYVPNADSANDGNACENCGCGPGSHAFKAAKVEGITMSNSLEKATRIAIDALNEAHEKHGIEDVMRCKFCVSKSAEMTIARHFAPIFDEIEHLSEALNHIVWIPYCGIDGADETGQYRNWPEQERDAMVEIAVKALMALDKLSDNMRDAPRRYIRDETEDCDHKWIDVRNEIVESGEWCRKCNTIKSLHGDSADGN